MTRIFVSGAFDDIRSRDIRFLQEAARLGPLTVALWRDAEVTAAFGQVKFPFDERRYVLEAIRFVAQVIPRGDANAGEAAARLPASAGEDRAAWSADGRVIEIPGASLAGFPVAEFDPAAMPADRPRVIVTGCYDWFHSGHVRFFEECAALGDLYVVAGHDANVRLLKGEGHPLFPAEERRYVVASCRYVTQALISSGSGWMDAEPEIAVVRPHMYAVNEDGDKPEKRAFCEAHGIEYVVLKRAPKPGLPRRSSTDLRGF